MSEQLYRWVKANERRPKEGWHNAKYGGDECVLNVDNGKLIITFPNGLIEDDERVDLIEWLEPYTPSPGDNQSLEAAANQKLMQMKYEGGWISSQMIEMFLAGAAYVKGGEEK